MASTVPDRPTPALWRQIVNYSILQLTVHVTSVYHSKLQQIAINRGQQSTTVSRVNIHTQYIKHTTVYYSIPQYITVVYHSKP